MGTSPTLIESGAQTILSITTDIDNQTRPGPAAPLNGGSLAPDIGADEFDGNFVDVAPPVITYTNLLGTCTTGDRTLTATVTDLSGIPTTGSLVPRVYYRKNANAYVSAAGVLATGSATNSTWNFTLSSSAMGGVSLGDVVYYFVIAGDAAPSPNTTSSPSVGLVAVDVNSVTTPPTTPSQYLVSALNGTYTVGSASTYTSLTAAAFAYNNSCLAGPVTFMLTDALYSTAETFPITFSNNIYASNSFSLLIRPATGVSPVISGTGVPSVLGFIGADFIKVDGSNNGSTSRDLTVENITSTLSTVCYVGNSSVTDAASNITINNCVITGSTGPTTTGGIIIGSGIVLGGAAEISNNNITVTGNLIKKTQNAVFAIGNATTPDLNWNISSNFCGSAIDADKLGFRGIAVQNARLFTVNSNTVSGIKNSVTTTAMAGLLIGAAVSDATVSHNLVAAMNNTNTTTTSGAGGIILSSSSLTCNILVSNNMVVDIRGYGGTGVTANNNGNGIAVTSGAGYRIYHNSVLLNTEQGNTALTSLPAGILITTGVSAVGAIDLRNNIFVNTQTTTTNRYAIYSAQTNSAIFSNIDNNIYSTTGPNLGFISSARATLANLQAGFGGNLNSSTIAPVFVSASDLHLVPTSNNAIDDLGTPVGIAIDIDNQTRSVTLPDIGADEFTGTGCAAITAQSLSTAAYTLCSNTQSVLLSGSGGSSGSGIIQRWKFSTTPGGPYTDLSTGTGITTSNLNTGTLTTGTNYYVLTTTCTSNSSVVTSNEATVTILASPSTSVSSSHTLACQGNTVTLTASGANTYTWSSNAGSATTTAVQVVPTTTTVYTFTGTSATSTCATSQSFQVLYSANPVITAATASTLHCYGTQATLTASGANTYTWTDGTNTITGATVTPTQSVSTVYTVTGTSTLGCISAPITRSTNVAPTITITGNSAVCPGETSSLTATGGTAYVWTNSSTSSSITLTPPSNTQVAVTGTNSFGCVNTTTQAISVGNVSISITGPSTVCAGSALTLTANGGATYTWSEGSQTSVITPTPSGNTTYSIVGASGACSNTAQVTVTVNPLPVTTITTNISPTICAGQTISLSGTGAITYTWNTPSTATTIAVSPTTTTNYTVTGKNSFGCTNPATIAVVSNPVPTISIAASATAVCLTSAATFTASGATTYTWNTTGSVSAIFSATPTANATYTAVGTNGFGCSGSKTVAIVSNTLPVITISPAASTVCLGEVASFTAGGASTYTWDGTTASVTVNYTPSANATHTVVGTTAQGCVGSLTAGIVVNSLPIVSIAPSSLTICAQSPATFTASGASTYQWNGATPGSTITLTQSANITHTVVGTSSLGCTATATVPVTVNQLPTVTITPPLSTLCVSSTSNFTASGAVTYVWYNTSTTPVIAITPTVTSSYSVVGTDANGCSSAGLAVIITNNLPALSVLPTNATVCPLTPVTLSVTGAGTYNWSNGLGTGSSVVVSPSVNSTYTVTGTNVATGCIGTKTVNVSTYTVPVISITPANPTLCLNATSTLTASGASSYTWSTLTAGSTVAVSPTSNENFTVTGQNSDGCISTKVASVTVNPLPVVNVQPSTSVTICNGESASFTVSGGNTYTWNPGGSTSNVFSVTPSGASFYSVDVTDSKGCQNSALITLLVNSCTGIKENASNANFVNVYPNPSTGSFMIDVYNNNAMVIVYNLLGDVICSEKLQSGKQALNLSEQAKGVYLMNVIVGEKHQTVRLVIE